MKPGTQPLFFRSSATARFCFSDLQAQQTAAFNEIKAHLKSHTVIVAEVEPTITVGRHGKTDKLATEAWFQTQGVDFHRIERGGFETYHGPGQWVLYPVARLETLVGDSRGVKEFVCRALTATNRVLSHFEVTATIKEGTELGIWVGRKKLVSLGIQVKDGIVLNGLSLNVTRHPKSFIGITPCGLAAEPGFLSELTDKKIDFQAAGELWAREITEEFKLLPC